MTTAGVPSAANPLALLGRHLAVAGDAVRAAQQAIPGCQEDSPADARRLEDLLDRLRELEEDLAGAPHPLLVRRIAEAQKPGGGGA